MPRVTEAEIGEAVLAICANTSSGECSIADLKAEIPKLSRLCSNERKLDGIWPKNMASTHQACIPAWVGVKSSDASTPILLTRVGVRKQHDVNPTARRADCISGSDLPSKLRMEKIHK